MILCIPYSTLVVASSPGHSQLFNVARWKLGVAWGFGYPCKVVELEVHISKDIVWLGLSQETREA